MQVKQRVTSTIRCTNVSNRLTREVRVSPKKFSGIYLILTTEENSRWRLPRITRNKKQQFPSINGQNGIAYSEEEIDEGFAYNVSDQYSISQGSADLNHIRLLRDEDQLLLKNSLIH